MGAKEKLAKKINSLAKTQKKQPGIEAKMQPKPLEQNFDYQGSNKLNL